MRRRVLFIVLFFLLVCQSAFAYIDPGTGSQIVQIVIATFAVGSTAIGAFIAKIFSKRKKGDVSPEKTDGDDE